MIENKNDAGRNLEKALQALEQAKQRVAYALFQCFGGEHYKIVGLEKYQSRDWVLYFFAEKGITPMTLSDQKSTRRHSHEFIGSEWNFKNLWSRGNCCSCFEKC